MGHPQGIFYAFAYVVSPAISFPCHLSPLMKDSIQNKHLQEIICELISHYLRQVIPFFHGPKVSNLSHDDYILIKF